MSKRKITNSQAKEIVELLSDDSHSAHYLRVELTKNIIPHLFEKNKKLTLESGKWYIGYHYGDRFLVNLSLTDELETHDLGYGVDYRHGWQDEMSFIKTFDYGFELATKEEVKEALTKEADKRGLIDGVFYKSSTKKIVNSHHLHFEDLEFFSENNFLSDGHGSEIFQNGEWAEVVQGITKKQAEKELGKKIID